MKTLLLLRHAKSSWKNPDLQDFDRPLSGRGRRAAPLLGLFMRDRKIKPDLILSSPAERTRQTVELISEAAGFGGELRYDERIYDASAEHLLEVVSQVEENINVLMLVGHNPGLEDLLLHLAGTPRRMPTAALAAITFDVEKWGRMKEQNGHLEWLVRPKELAAER